MSAPAWAWRDFVVLARVPSVELTAVEIDAGLCALAAKNAERNGFGDKVSVVNADVTAPGKSRRAAGLLSESYDQVIANPPFHAEGKVRAAPDRGRAAAHVMDREGLAAWVRFFAAMAAPKALLTLIHRPDCLGELLPLLAGRFGDIAVFPLFPKRGEPATRIIVQAEKGSRAGLSLLPGLVLHRGGRKLYRQRPKPCCGEARLSISAAATNRKGRRLGGVRRQPYRPSVRRLQARQEPPEQATAQNPQKPKGHALSGMALCQTRSALGGARA